MKIEKINSRTEYVVTYCGDGGVAKFSNSFGVCGTLRITNRRPSVEPMPIEANDRTDVTSEKI
uniref:Uncharacterized protein n=1 Tax=Glossina palpalis gambiensis TaxID=67801 RepID=A0A1B0C312_9MUSC